MVVQLAGRDLDLEAQPPFLQLPEVGGSTTQETGSRMPDTNRDTIPGGSVSPSLEANSKELPAASQEGRGRSEIQEMSVLQPENEDVQVQATGRLRAGQGQVQVHAEERIRNTAANDPPVDCGSLGEGSDKGPLEKHMIGDFDGGANALWTLYGREAKSYDEARIQTLKDDMDGVLIFAGLFSAALTSFIIDSKQDLKASPADQTVFYLQQNNALLSQISEQLSSIVPQVSTPSTLPTSFPALNPSRSVIRVNAFWLMSLVFSLSAALLAILVQQWVRNYMHVFQRYSDPLKCARLRQYLHEGCERWYMPVVAEAVHGLLHLSLFLFFAGLCDAVLNINKTVGLTTIIPIGISGLVYIFTTFAPVIYPQSPYQNSFSGLVWYLAQKLHGRTYKDRNFDGEMKPVNSNMAQGQLELAMEETEERKGRDERAIRWLGGNLTEDAELELFVMAIPGSFNAEWGIEVWKKVFNTTSNGDKSQNDPTVGPVAESAVTVPLVGRPPPLPLHIRTVSNIFDSISRRVRARTAGDSPANATALYPAPHLPNVHIHTASPYYVRRLSAHVAHMLETCHDRRLFASDDLWRRRTRACIDSAASLVSWANAELDWFGNIVKLLGDIASVEKTRESSLLGIDQFFVMRWTFLSLMTIRPILARNETVQMYARMAVSLLGGEDDGTSHASEHWDAMTVVQKIDETFDRAWRCLVTLYLSLSQEEDLTVEQVVEILRNHEHQISELEQIEVEADSLGRVDLGIFRIQSCIDADSHGIITRQLPGVEFDAFHPEHIHFGQTIDWFRDPHKRQLILPGHKLRSICSLTPTFRDILEGRWNEDAYQEILKNLRAFVHVPTWQGNLLQRQIWRLQDLRDGGGLGFTVELFFLALKQLLSTSSAKESPHSALYVGTFQAITSDWRQYKHSLGTQQVLLDIAASHGGIISDFEFPARITDELLILLGNVLEGQTGPHIDNAVQQLRYIHRFDYRTGHREWWNKVLEAIIHAQARTPSL